MKRFAVPLVIVGSLAVLAALVVLLRSITSTSPAAPVTQAPPPRPARTITTVAPAPTPTAPSTRAPMPPLPQARPRTDDSRPTPPSLGTSETASDDTSDAPPGTRLNTKGLQFGLPHLREKIAANAPHVARCVGSSKPTGDATLTFIVAQRAGKIVVEQSDADREASTIKDETLLECLTTATAKIQLDGLPREAAAIYVTRVVSLNNGAITDDKPLKFSYIR